MQALETRPRCLALEILVGHSLCAKFQLLVWCVIQGFFVCVQRCDEPTADSACGHFFAKGLALQILGAKGPGWGWHRASCI